METRIQRIARMFCSGSMEAALLFVCLLDSGVSWANAAQEVGISGCVQ